MFVDLDNLLAEFDDDRCERQLSAPEKAILNCTSINWLLYRSKYWLGTDWNNIPSIKVKQDLINGLISWVYCGDSKNVIEMYKPTLHPYMARSLLMK